MKLKTRNEHPPRRGLYVLCALCLTVCLSLPFGVFALWDNALLRGDHPRPDAAESQAAELSDAGRKNLIACLLYARAHSLNVEVEQENKAGGKPLEALSATGETALGRASAGAALTRLEDAGLITPLQHQAADAALTDARYGYRVSELTGGLRSVELTFSTEGYAPADTTPETAAPITDERQDGIYLSFLLLPDDTPLSWSYQSGPGMPRDGVLQETRPGGLQKVIAMLGLDTFTDWQTLAWGEQLPSSGEAAYSAAAQLYISYSTAYGSRFNMASMTPQRFAELQKQSEG